MRKDGRVERSTQNVHFFTFADENVRYLSVREFHVFVLLADFCVWGVMYVMYGVLCVVGFLRARDVGKITRIKMFSARAFK